MLHHAPTCISCEGDHKSTAAHPQCAEYKNEQLIKKYMAFLNFSYMGAKLKYKKISDVSSNNNIEFPSLPVANRFQALANAVEDDNGVRINVLTFFSSRKNVRRNNTKSTEELLF